MEDKLTLKTEKVVKTKEKDELGDLECKIGRPMTELNLYIRESWKNIDRW